MRRASSANALPTSSLLDMTRSQHLALRVKAFLQNEYDRALQRISETGVALARDRCTAEGTRRISHEPQFGQEINDCSS